MAIPRDVDLEITSKCNLRCSYCYYFDNPSQEYTDLPLDQWLSFIDELGECGIMTVTLCGGEPFIRPDLKEIIAHIVRNRMRFTILTNGTLLTDDWGTFLAETGRCDIVQISLDGSKPEIHDSCRGAGSFSQAVAGIRIMQRHKVPVTVRLTIHRHNVHDLDKAAQFILEDLGLNAFSVNSAGYLGSCKEQAESIQLTVEDRYLAMKSLDRIARKYPDRVIALAGPPAEVRMYRRMIRAAKEKAPAFSIGGRLTGCGCIFNKLSVQSDGNYVPCNMLPHLVLGNIREHTLRDIWLNAPVLKTMRRRSEIELSSLESCKNCPFIPYCTGNCPGLAHAITGDLNQPSPADCLRNYLKDGGKIP